MKRIKYVLLAISFWLLADSPIAYANPVKEKTAQTVAVNFYSRNTNITSPQLTLSYTEYATDGQPVYYVFDVNTNNGFVIVSAEDAAHPILGYSDKGKYIISRDNNNVAWWINCRKHEIIYARTNHITATADIANEWAGYINNTTANKLHNPLSIVGPLLQTTWDQSWPYNAICPGNSVTGCVATAMAQIMKYWSYPPVGHGSGGYWDEQAYGYTSSFGYLSADYDTSNYNWSAMPLNVNSNNNEVAKLMYDCGVSVVMDYNLSESGAWVITGDYPVCAQVAFVKYFGYNPSTIQGLYQSKYTLANWESLIENELNNGRPVQYVGWDSVNNESGHTWVCDGYNSNNNTFDMNWGWSGGDDGWYSLSALDAGGYNFNWWDEALIGIEPPIASPYFTANPTFGCKGMSVQYTDQSFIDSNLTITSRTWLFPGGTPATSGAISPTVVYNTPGTYNAIEIIGDARGTDTLVRQAYISVDSTSALTLMQGFESATFPPPGWALNNPNFYNYFWQLNTIVGGFGRSAQCMYFNNCQGYQDYAPPGKAGLDIIGQRQQIYTPEYDYTNIPNPEIYFDVAYAPYNSTFSDTLVIYYSTDCGATFTSIYSKGGLTLGTTGKYVTSDTNNIGCFTPSNTDWRTDTIHIPAIAGKSNVMFSFENRSGNGSPLYIDNINIPATATNVENLSATTSLRVYPNPGNGLFTFELKNADGRMDKMDIYNVLGEKVYSQYSTFTSPLYIDLSSEAKGVYIYRVFSETGSAISSGRLVLE